MHQSSSGVKSAVIDFRVRPPFNSFSNLTIFNARLAAHNRPASWVGPVPESVLQRSMDLFLAELDAAGVQRAVVWGRAVKDPNASTTLEDVADLVKRYPTRFLGFGGIRIPNNPVESEIAVSETEKALVNLGLSGITPGAGLRVVPDAGSGRSESLPGLRAVPGTECRACADDQRASRHCDEVFESGSRR